VGNLFFLLSGENETLPAAELSAILEAENYAFRLTEKLDQVVRLDSDVACIKAVMRRAAYARVSASELFSCAANEDAIETAAGSIDFQTVLSQGETFAVRIHRVREYSPKKDTMQLEISLGKHILQNSYSTRVNLKKPDRTFIGILTSGKLVFGVKLAEAQIKTFSERRPRKKPFFHPSAMPSKLARCMVNLSHAKAGSLLLDPFCGTGSSLIEAALINCRVVGVDAQRRMIVGCRKNLRHFNVNAEGLVMADARHLPLATVDCMVTDPPYGRSASTLRSTTKALVEAVLFSVHALLGKGQRICIASPKTLHISRLGEQMGYKHVESHFAYVHRTLTREIAVFEKL
jgi:tRNA (guanine10-N2)-dimethyltransferase